MWTYSDTTTKVFLMSVDAKFILLCGKAMLPTCTSKISWLFTQDSCSNSSWALEVKCWIYVSIFQSAQTCESPKANNFIGNIHCSLLDLLRSVTAIFFNRAVYRILVLRPELNPHPQQWERSVLPTGLPGNSVKIGHCFERMLRV